MGRRDSAPAGDENVLIGTHRPATRNESSRKSEQLRKIFRFFTVSADPLKSLSFIDGR
jgi:hypothetical protein